MQIILKATNLTVTPSLNEYIERALGSLNKLVKNMGEETEMRVEVGRSTFHHRKGEVFFAEANLKIGKNILRSSAESLTVQAAVDEVHDELRNEIYKFKGKRETIFRRGARSFAKLLKISPLARFRKK
ncbi:MAG: ribosome-associated translation inhibitor RaiA [Patescibacteria group bacterium]